MTDDAANANGRDARGRFTEGHPALPVKVTPKRQQPAWQAPFLRVLRNTANVRAACNAAGITRAGAYKARKNDSEFEAEWEEALEDACDILEFVARRRALETSDGLLVFLLKAHRPERYADRLQVEQIVRKRAAGTGRSLWHDR